MDKSTAITFIVMAVLQLALLTAKFLGAALSWWLVLVPLWIFLLMCALAFAGARIADRDQPR